MATIIATWGFRKRPRGGAFLSNNAGILTFSIPDGALNDRSSVSASLDFDAKLANVEQFAVSVATPYGKIAEIPVRADGRGSVTLDIPADHLQGQHLALILDADRNLLRRAEVKPWETDGSRFAIRQITIG